MCQCKNIYIHQHYCLKRKSVHLIQTKQCGFLAVIPYSCSAGTRSSIVITYFFSLGPFWFLELCVIWLEVLILQCCSASLAMSDKNFCEAMAIRRINLKRVTTNQNIFVLFTLYEQLKETNRICFKYIPIDLICPINSVR